MVYLMHFWSGLSYEAHFGCPLDLDCKFLAFTLSGKVGGRRPKASDWLGGPKSYLENHVNIKIGKQKCSKTCSRTTGGCKIAQSWHLHSVGHVLQFCTEDSSPAHPNLVTWNGLGRHIGKNNLSNANRNICICVRMDAHQHTNVHTVLHCVTYSSMYNYVYIYIYTYSYTCHTYMNIYIYIT